MTVRRATLLTQVLLVNLLMIVAAVVATMIAANPWLSLGTSRRPRLSSGSSVALTILVNVLMLQRRFRPLERLVDEMERADLSRPGADLRTRPAPTVGRRRSSASTARSA